MTTVYLIRHSVRIPRKKINKYNTDQNELIKVEKICLSSIGEERAKKLAEKEELQNIDVVYTSNCVRTLQTAKYLVEKQNLEFNIDERLDERRVGIPNDDVVKNWAELQFTDENYKTIGGESQKEVRERVDEVINEILNENKDKRIAVYMHGYAIIFYLSKFCKLTYLKEGEEGYTVVLNFKGKDVIDKPINAPELIKVVFNDNNEPESIEVIRYDDIEYMRGV